MLEIKNLSLGIHTSKGLTQAVSDVSFQIKPGKVLGLVGESGCGKTLTAQSILRLGEHQGVKVMGGDVLLNGKSVFDLSSKQLCQFRGAQVSMVFQEPMTALNPVFSIGSQMIEVIRLHLGLSKKEARQRAVSLLKDVGLLKVERILDQYPDSLSGGMRQRVLIAMAISAKPAYIIADEPTTALDVSVQSKIIELLKKLQRENQVGLLLVSHDFGLIAELADDVAVMYAGQIVEYAPVNAIFDRPLHPYTRFLMACRPEVVEDGQALPVIEGHVPLPGQWEKGCRFYHRCHLHQDQCRESDIALRSMDDQQKLRCVLDDHA
ncbi:MAG: ABC transporter ATP-binding protein [Mariprofundaceae bacterium]|nr:ABC transporter ATP-binding protein [Mariprofundaceae bacterium]